MGDAADLDFDTGSGAWFAHLAGECDEWCPYCEEDEWEDRRESIEPIEELPY